MSAWVVLVVSVVGAVALALGGLPLVGIPIALIALAIAGAVALKRRRTGEAQVQEFRAQSHRADQDAGDVEFSERDRQTLYRR